MNRTDPPRDEELQAAPWLRSLDPAALPPIPAGYFEGFAGRLQARLKGEATEAAPSLLPAAGKPKPAVPAGYFEALPKQVMARVQADEAPWVRPFRRQAYLALSLAAAMGLLLLGWWAWPPAETAPAWADMSDEALISMVQREQVGTAQLLNSLDENSLQALQQRYQQQLSEQDLIEALDEATLHELELEWESPWPALSPDGFSDSL